MKLENNKIFLQEISLRAHTSKFRLKRRVGNANVYSVAQADQRITVQDYVEWQISYDIKLDSIYNALKSGDDLGDLLGETKPELLEKEIAKSYDAISVLPTRTRKRAFLGRLLPILQNHQEITVVKQRQNTEIVVLLNELSDFLKIFYTNQIITKKQIEELIRVGVGLKQTLDEEFEIKREADKGNKEFYGFKLAWEKHPIFTRKIPPDFSIEIIKRHKQYAIGYQNMIFLCIDAGAILGPDGKSVIGKNPAELGWVSVGLGSAIVIEALRAFMVASNNHRSDIIDICRAVLEYSRT